MEETAARLALGPIEFDAEIQMRPGQLHSLLLLLAAELCPIQTHARRTICAHGWPAEKEKLICQQPIVCVSSHLGYGEPPWLSTFIDGIDIHTPSKT